MSIEGMLRGKLSLVYDKLYDSIAKDGLNALKRVLDNSGFADSPYLRDYSVYSEIEGSGDRSSVIFYIELNQEAINDETKRKMRAETNNIFKDNAKKVENRQEAREFFKLYTMGPDGTPLRILGSRKAAKKRKEARRFQKDARKTAFDRNKINTTKDSGERYVDHEFEIHSPRSMEVDMDGKLLISMQREIRNTNKKVIFPKGDYQGIVKKFIIELKETISLEFTKELANVIQSNLDRISR